MRIDRRHFIWYSAAGVAFVGCGRWLHHAGNKAAVQVNFEGLYLVERKGKSASIHLLDGAAVGFPTHKAVLTVDASTIDQSQTKKPDPSHIRHAGTSELWSWDLNGVPVVMPLGDDGNDDLTIDETSPQDDLETPNSDNGWNSLKRLPDVKELFGATKLLSTSSGFIATSVALRHGHLTALKPVDLGATAVWKYTVNGEEKRRSFSDLLSYTCPTAGKARVIQVGTQRITLKPDAQVTVGISNAPPPKACPSPCVPNMDHFVAFGKLVDATVVPKIELVTPFNPPSGGSIIPDYCPGGTV
jgi:hypothetical protein